MVAKKASAVAAVKQAVAKTAGRKKVTASVASVAPARGTASVAAKKVSTAKKAAPAKKAAAKKATATKPPAQKAAAKKAPAKKASAQKAPAAAKPVPAQKAVAKKSAPAKKTAAGSSGRAARRLAVREGEKPWTSREIAEVRETLEGDAARLKAEIAATEEEIGHLLREGGEGAGNDQADVGSNTFERDHEMTMAKNARESLTLVTAALNRIDAGTYGVCESCGQPIGKMRLQAFPRATLCMECKQRQERR